MLLFLHIPYCLVNKIYKLPVIQRAQKLNKVNIQRHMGKSKEVKWRRNNKKKGGGGEGQAFLPFDCTKLGRSCGRNLSYFCFLKRQ